MAMKDKIFWLHKQAGIWLAVFFVIFGLTGSVLVFMRDIEPILYPTTLAPEAPKESYRDTTLDDALAAYQALPESADFKLFRLYAPSNKDSVFRIVAMDTRPEGNSDFYFYYFSPYNAAYLGKDMVKTKNISRWSMPITRLLLQVHIQLMAGSYGGLLVGLLGITFFLTTIIGFYLWWPRNWKKAFSIATNLNRTKLMMDLHRQVGFWAGLVLLMITFTGIYHAFPDQFTSVLSKVMPLGESAKQVEQRKISPATSLQAYADYVNEVYPDSQNMQLFLNELDKDKLSIRISQKGEMNATEGKTTFDFNYQTGELVKHYDPSTTKAGSRFINWMLPIHNGEAFGLVGRIIYSLVGLMPLFLFITGFYVFYKKYQVRKKTGLFNFIKAIFSAR